MHPQLKPQTPLLLLWPPAPTAPAAAAPPLQTRQRPAAAPAAGSRAAAVPATGRGGDRDHPRPPHSSAVVPRLCVLLSEQRAGSFFPPHVRSGRAARPVLPALHGVRGTALRCIAPRCVVLRCNALHRISTCIAARCIALLPRRARCPGARAPPRRLAPAGGERSRPPTLRHERREGSRRGTAGRDGQTEVARAGPSGKRSSQAVTGRPARRRGLHFPWGATKGRPRQPPPPSPRRRRGDAGTAIRDVVWLRGR